MPKLKVSVSDRANEFVSNGFYVSDKMLMCKFCSCRLDHERRDTLVKHVSSEKHKRAAKKSSHKRQVSIGECSSLAKKVRDSKEEFIIKTTEACVAANVPVEKLDHPKIRDWFQEYVKGGGDLPTADWIRKKYIPIVGEKKTEEIKSAVMQKPIAVLCDETTDRGGRCVFNIMFKTLEPSASQQSVFLAASVVLDSANATSCSQSVIEILRKYEISYEQVVAFVSDSARYMKKCATTLQGVFGEHLLHVECWAHKLHLVGVVLQTNLEELNNVVVKVKTAFLNTRKRKHQYMEFLQSKHPDNTAMHKLFPQPVVTRWNSWFESVNYLNDHLQDIVEFLDNISEENSGVKFLKEMSPEELSTVKLQALFVSENCKDLVNLLTFLEGSNYPTAHVLSSKLSDVKSIFSVLSTGVFSSSVNKQLSQLHSVKQANVKQTLKLAAHKCELKLADLINRDPCRKTYEAIGNLFNTRNLCRIKTENKNLQKFIPNLPLVCQLPTDTFTYGFLAFKKIVEEELLSAETNQIDITKVLCSLKSDYSEFAVASLRALWFPSSNVDTERSFSKYSVVVSDRRQRLTPENAEMLTMISF